VREFRAPSRAGYEQDETIKRKRRDEIETAFYLSRPGRGSVTEKRALKPLGGGPAPILKKPTCDSTSVLRKKRERGRRKATYVSCSTKIPFAPEGGFLQP